MGIGIVIVFGAVSIRILSERTCPVISINTWVGKGVSNIAPCRRKEYLISVWSDELTPMIDYVIDIR